MTIRIDNFPVLHDCVCTWREILCNCNVMFACVYTNGFFFFVAAPFNGIFGGLQPYFCVKRFLYITL
jgi:hypothetical protein